MMCVDCHAKMLQKYKRQVDGMVIRTRVCPQCHKRLKTVELEYNIYDKSVDVLNKIIKILDVAVPEKSLSNTIENGG